VAALENKSGPTALLLTRQNLPIFDRKVLASAENLKQGAYTIWENSAACHDIIIMASGSEVWVSLEAGKRLAQEGKKVRVVSFPSWELFEQQDDAYKVSVFPAECHARLAVEAGCSIGWEKFVGREGKIIGIDHFGASAPGAILAEKFGITVENVYKQARSLIALWSPGY